MNDLTIIYFTSNQEKPEFEERIQRSLIENINGLPIISVSQKQIDLGKNICVGDIGVSSQNAFRQFQIGAIEAKTKYVCGAESDFLYTKEYFNFNPEQDNIAYNAHPIYVLFAQHKKMKCFVRKPRGSELTIIVGRDYVINGIEKLLEDYGMFGGDGSDAHNFWHLWKLMQYKKIELTIPLVSLKTDNALHRKVPYIRRSLTRELPYWGEAHDLIRKYI